jgi:hypothetical protein
MCKLIVPPPAQTRPVKDPEKGWKLTTDRKGGQLRTILWEELIVRNKSSPNTRL